MSQQFSVSTVSGVLRETFGIDFAVCWGNCDEYTKGVLSLKKLFQFVMFILYEDLWNFRRLACDNELFILRTSVWINVYEYWKLSFACGTKMLTIYLSWCWGVCWNCWECSKEGKEIFRNLFTHLWISWLNKEHSRVIDLNTFRHRRTHKIVTFKPSHESVSTKIQRRV